MFFFPSISVHHDSHQKTRIPQFLPFLSPPLHVTPMPIYFYPIYFYSFRLYPRLCLYPLRVLSSHNIFTSETRELDSSFFLLSLSLLLLFLSSFFSTSFNSTRVSLLQLTKIYDLLLFSSLFLLLFAACVLSLSHSLCPLFRFSLSRLSK